MRIGVDIDGVVSDSYPAWLQELNLHYGKNITVIDDYEMHLAFDVPRDDMNNFFVGNVERLLTIPNPVNGAKEGIETLLREGHEIFYVTARTPEEKEITVRWLKKHEIPYEDEHVLFSGFKSKVDLIKQWKLEVFVEDYEVNANTIAEYGVPVLLLNASYNLSKQLREGITRCQNWQEILERIRDVNSQEKGSATK